MLFRCLFLNRLISTRSINTFKSIKMESISQQQKHKEVTVAVCQMTSSCDKKKNLESFTRLVEQAKDMNAKMVFFPEACDYISNSKMQCFDLAETINGHLMTSYKNLAKQYSLWLSIGGFHEMPLDSSKDTKTYNTHFIINDKGEIVASYRKLHLFNVSIPEQNIRLHESETTLPGQIIREPVDTPIGKVGLGICYDVRFPEFGTIQRKLGADVLTYPSAFTHTTGEAHWEMLLRTRAIENQCYVIAAAQAGKHNDKRISHGRAMIIDPWGAIQAELPKYHRKYEDESLVAVASIKTEVIETVRQQMPIFDHRRPDCYSLTTESLCHKFYFDCPDFDARKPFEFADKQIPRETVFYETIYSIAFTNIRCVVPGHVLIASKRNARKLTDLYCEEQADLFQATIKVQRLMERVHNVTSSSIVCQDGVDAGQTVPHVHIHVMPRLPNDFKRNDEIYDTLATHDQRESQMPFRPLQEMIDEAKILRDLMKTMV